MFGTPKHQPAEQEQQLQPGAGGLAEPAAPNMAPLYITANPLAGAQIGANAQVHVEHVVAAQTYQHHEHHYAAQAPEELYATDTILTAVRACYQQKRTIGNDLTGTVLTMEEGYVRLAMVEETEQKEKEQEELKKQDTFRDGRSKSFEDIYETKKPIELSELFKITRSGEDKVGFTLSAIILGRAGIGKTTVCQYMAYHWSGSQQFPKGLFNEEFVLLVWVPLRNLLNKDRYPNGQTRVSDVVYEECLLKNENNEGPFEKGLFAKSFAAMLEAMKTKNQRTLYLLDGYDEVAHVLQQPEPEQTPQGRLIQTLLSMECVVLTSRPHYIKQNPLTHGLNARPKKVENIGFLNEDIDRYIDAFFAHADLETKEERGACAAGLKTFLHKNPNAKGLAHVPINLSFICDIWKQHRSEIQAEQFTDLRLTTLYCTLLSNLCHRYIRKFHPENAPYDIDFIETHEHCAQVLSFLKKLAFQQMQKEQLMISNADFVALKQQFYEKGHDLQSNVLNLGLLKTTETGQTKNTEYYFIHLTFQEFLAAYYIADELTKPKEEAGEDMEMFIKHHRYHPRYEIVWWFVAGLLYEKKRPHILEKFFQLLDHPENHDLIGLAHLCLTVRCMDEGRLDVDAPRKRAFLSQLVQWIQQLVLKEKKYIQVLWQCLFISPHVYNQDEVSEAIIHLIEKGEKTSREFIISSLSEQAYLPDSILLALSNTLNDDNSVEGTVIEILRAQSALPSQVVEKLMEIILNGKGHSRQIATEAVCKQSFLPQHVLVRLGRVLQEHSAFAKEKIIEMFNKQLSLPQKILPSLISAVNYERNEVDVRKSALNILIKYFLILNTEAVLTQLIGALSDKQEVIREAAFEQLKAAPSLPEHNQLQLIKLMTDSRWRFEIDAAVELLREHLSLSFSEPLSEETLQELTSKLLYDQDTKTRHAAAVILSKQPVLPTSVLFDFIDKLKDGTKGLDVRKEIAFVLERQSFLPNDFLLKLAELISKGLLENNNKNLENNVITISHNQQDLEEIITLFFAGIAAYDTIPTVSDTVIEELTKPSFLSKLVLQRIPAIVKEQFENHHSTVAVLLDEQPSLSPPTSLTLSDTEDDLFHCTSTDESDDDPNERMQKFVSDQLTPPLNKLKYQV